MPMNPIQCKGMPDEHELIGVMRRMFRRAERVLHDDLWEDVLAYHKDEVCMQIRDLISKREGMKDENRNKPVRLTWLGRLNSDQAYASETIRDALLSRVECNNLTQKLRARLDPVLKKLLQRKTVFCERADELAHQVVIASYWVIRNQWEVDYHHPAFALTRMGVVVISDEPHFVVYGKDGEPLGEIKQRDVLV